MFRFIALAWDAAVELQASAARQLSISLLHARGWQPVFAHRGLSVFVTGQQAGVNQAQVIEGDAGIVLGRLFRSSDAADAFAGKAPLQLDALAADPQACARALVQRFWGRYVALLRTPHRGSWVLRDPRGFLPCHVMQHDGVAIVFSWLEDVLTLLPQVPQPAVNWPALTQQVLLGDNAGCRETALQGVAQLLPGELVALHEQPATGGELVWNAAAVAQAVLECDVPTAAALLHHTVSSTVQAWAGCYPSIVLRLSGGVDSSIVLGCVAPGQTPAQVTCLNYHSQGAASDERDFARMAAARSNRQLVELEWNTGFNLQSVLHAARTPSPCHYIGRTNAALDAAVARDRGAPVLFTGGGGDQLFFEYRRWWPAADSLQLHGPGPRFLGAAMAAARLGNVSVWKAVQLAAAERLRPGSQQEVIAPQAALATADARAAAAQRHRPEHPALRHASQLPLGKRMQLSHLLHPFGYYDPLLREAAPELLDPLMSQPIVELCLRLPTFTLAYDGRGRGLARLAFSGDIPEAIATRRSKGGIHEHFKAVLSNNLEMARALLLQGELASRGILDRARLQETLSGHPMQHAAHVGELHLYVAVEAWLQRWASARG